MFFSLPQGHVNRNTLKVIESLDYAFDLFKKILKNNPKAWKFKNFEITFCKTLLKFKTIV